MIIWTETILDLPLLFLCQGSPQPFPGSCSAEARQDTSWWVCQGCWSPEAGGNFAEQQPDRDVSLFLHWYLRQGWNTARESLVSRTANGKLGGVRTVSANREANTGVLRHQECSLRGIKPQAPCYDSRLAGWFVLSSVGFGSPINIAEVQVPTDTGKGCTGVASTTEGWACLSPGCHPPAEGSGRCFMASKVAMQQRSPCSVMADWC